MHTGHGVSVWITTLNVGATALWTVGVFASLYAGVLDPSVRVTASTLSSIINGGATVMMAIFIDPHMSGEALLEDTFVCCLPEDHGLAGEPVIDLIRLADEPFVMFVRDVAPANYDNVIAICMQAGFEPQTRYAARQWLTIVALVANGLGVSLVPASIKRAGIAGARFVPISNPNAQSRAHLLWHPEAKTPGLAYFIDAARAVLRSR